MQPCRYLGHKSPQQAQPIRTPKERDMRFIQPYAGGHLRHVVGQVGEIRYDDVHQLWHWGEEITFTSVTFASALSTTCACELLKT